MHRELRTEPGIYNRGHSAIFNEPEIIGYFSTDCEYTYQEDTSQLKFATNVKEQPVNFDLNLLMEDGVYKPDIFEPKLGNLLRFIIQNQVRLKFPIKKSIHEACFYTYRGCLKMFLCTPYENQDDWRFVATLYKGNIYLCPLYTQAKIKKIQSTTERDRKFTAWGHKFEEFVLSDSPSSHPNPNKPVNCMEEFNVMFTTKINDHILIYGAEMDGIRCDNQTQEPPQSGTDDVINYLMNEEFIELKTSRAFSPSNNTFRQFKSRNWWCQSYLVGISTITCGCRDDNGIVHELQHYSLQQLERIARNWQPRVCLNFLDAILTYIKNCFEKEINQKHKYVRNIQNLPLMWLHFEWAPGMSVRVTDYDYEADPILPEWFINQFRNVDREE